MGEIIQTCGKCHGQAISREREEDWDMVAQRWVQRPPSRWPLGMCMTCGSQQEVVARDARTKEPVEHG